jgi:putative PIN family toxin of toxin-antitoxin system
MFAQALGIIYNTTMPVPSVVLDTNVLVSALRLQYGTSNRLLQLVGTGLFEINLSVPLVLEYEEVLLRQIAHFSMTESDVHTLLDYLCQVARHHEIFFLWRPMLHDPDDEMVLDLAVTARCTHIITHNVRDFTEAEAFGIEVTRPRSFLTVIGGSS